MTNPVHVPSNIDFPRITHEGFLVGRPCAPRRKPTFLNLSTLQASIFSFLAFAIIGVGARVGLRIFRLHTFGLDDGLLLFALAALAGACALLTELGDMLYLQIYVSLHLIPFGADGFGADSSDALLRFHRLLEAASVLEWVAIFFAKFSLLIFFRKLVNRLHKLEIWWRVVLGLVIVLGAVCIPFGFIMCTDFTKTFQKVCNPVFIVKRENIYTYLTVTLDIISDLLVLSIPLSVLWMVKIDLHRKFVLGAMLCLSIFMIIIAIVRVAMLRLPGDVTDTTWLFFWQTLEGAIATTMVVLTSFRSLYGTDRATKGKHSAHINDESLVLRAKRNRPNDGVQSTIQASKPSVTRQADEELTELNSFKGNIKVTKEIFQRSSSPVSMV